MNKFTVFACGLSIGLSFAFSTYAAGKYSPAYQVNESIITSYEIQQRIKMLKSFGTTGDLRGLAVEQLIEDRLRLQAAKKAGITTSENDLFDGMVEFAARGDFSIEQLNEYFDERDVDQETFRDFVRAGLLWRSVIGSQFASKVNVTDVEVDARLDVSSVNFPKTVNVAEIIMPIEERGAVQTRALADRLTQTIKSTEQFSTAAKKFSKSNTSVRGGSMGWIPMGNLPEEISGAIAALEPGQMTAPILLGDAIALYQLLGVREAKSASEQVISVSYVTVAMPASKSGKNGQTTTATKLINSVDTCLDLQAKTSKFGENAVTRQSLPAAQVPPRIGAELAKLDPNEALYYTAESGAINVVMLCNRAKDLPEGAREQIRNALFGQRIGSFGDGYLQELRSDATIIAK
jgi:peptidyl-prolyl cis-trans isomerase SurA